MSDFSLNPDFELESDNIDDAYITEFEVTDSSRIDVIVAQNCGITRSAAAKLIQDGNVTVSGKIASKSLKPKCGEVICVTLPPPKLSDAIAQDIPLDIVYEDTDLLVVNKPRGMVVHPAPGNPDGTLVNALLYHCKGSLSGIGGVIRPGIVHRIDKDTSGLLIVAKNDEAHIHLASQIKEHSFTRIYNAILYGTFKEGTGTIDLPIGRHPKDRKKMAVTEKNSKNAITHYTVLNSFKDYSLVELKLETGRTHQIRVHMSKLGHAVIGDPLYAPNGGKNRFGLIGQCLHARVIGFIHPKTGKYMEFSSELPDYFNSILSKLEGTR